MKSAGSTMSYLELLKIVAPETIVVITALAVLAIGLATSRGRSSATIPFNAAQGARNKPVVARISFAVGLRGLALATGAILLLTKHGALFGGILRITALTPLCKIIGRVLAFVTVLISTPEKARRNAA